MAHDPVIFNAKLHERRLRIIRKTLRARPWWAYRRRIIYLRVQARRYAIDYDDYPRWFARWWFGFVDWVERHTDIFDKEKT